ncbi:MAG: ParB/RepB/Spo0J family partition protein [Thermoanaerobaculia bacterium]|nr:ParB/RepB/Spo0J family partition protein [Thermoanaerobaculia bacterium]
MNARKRGLGRGLDALLGSEPLVETAVGSVVNMLEVSRLEPNRFQPRTHFDESGLEELAESIKAQGIVQPIVVTPKGDGRYVIVAGERRWRASQRAGLETVPVVVREVENDREMLELALVENLQRADLNPIEESEAYRALSDDFGLSQDDIAKRVGKGRTTITNALRLLRLPDEIQDYLRTGQLTAGQARPLLSLPAREQQIELCERAIREGLTARDLEAAVAEPIAGVPKTDKKSAEVDVHTRAATERLTQVLQTKVEIRRRRRGGTLQIYFHSEDELIRLYDRLVQTKDEE